MSAIAQSTGSLRGPPSRAPTGARPDRYPPNGRAGFTFADAFLAEQGVPPRARRSEARALALLLAKTLHRPDEPVVVSARDGGEECGFEPRTWWHVKRRLLERGHLLATAGGGPPSGRPGGRGRKGAYFVAPATLARFHDWIHEQSVKAAERQRRESLETLNVGGESVNVAAETLKARLETVKVRRETMNARAEESELSHHRPLRVLSKERTSDVPSFEGDEEIAKDGDRTPKALRRATSRYRDADAARAKDAGRAGAGVELAEKGERPAATPESVNVRGDAVKDRPSPSAIWAEIRRERSIRVKLALLRVLEVSLLHELVAGSVNDRHLVTASPEDLRERTVNDGSSLAPVSSCVGTSCVGTDSASTGPLPGVPAHPAPMAERTDSPKPPGSSGPSERPRGARRRRAAAALWAPEGDEATRVFAQLRAVLEWANREHGARFDVAKSANDTLRYPYEIVRGAVANVLLKRARGYRFTNAGAVLWDGITLEGYKLEEFAAGPFDDVLARVGASAEAGAPASATLEPPRDPARRPEAKVPKLSPAKLPAAPLRFDRERRERLELQAAYEALAEGERAEIDRRAEALAREELGETTSPPRLRLLQLDKRNELLRARAEAGRDAMGRETESDESQIPLLDSMLRRE